jgi:hypothetical protein
VAGERLDRHVVGAREGTREKRQPLGVRDARLLDRDPGDDPGRRNEVALLGRRPRERHLVVRQAVTEGFGVRFHRQSFCPLAEDDDVRLVGHGCETARGRCAQSVWRWRTYRFVLSYTIIVYA